MWIDLLVRVLSINNNDDIDNIKLMVKAIDKKDIKKIAEIKNNDKNKRKDIVYEIYNKKLFTFKRLNFIVNDCFEYLPVSSSLIKELIKSNKIELLDIIFSKYYLYDRKFVLKLLFYYKYKSQITTSDLEKKISKYKITIENLNEEDTIFRYLKNPCKNGQLAVVKYLFQHGADINGEGSCGMRPLHLASNYGQENVVRYLLEHGVNINKKSKYGITPIQYACENGHETVVKILLEHGASIYTIYNKGTVLHMACEEGYEQLVKIFVEHGVNVNEMSSKGIPLHLACEKGHANIVKYLIEHGADIKGAPLHIACRKGFETIVKILVEHGAEINEKNAYFNETPLYIACEKGYVTIVKFLVEHGANIKEKCYKRMPLHIACVKKNLTLVKYLVEHGTDILEKDGFGDSALSLAQHNKCINIEKYLTGILNK